ncbi:hypothetical protein BU14_0072s0017 [Porphyra umbilicalis]|uniref:Uncharacterized protein n=1 Tax=Porphyra umbilicalis TaxID=2786 RepID=A0A1X6PFN1_PORUM|nr:hypothetical protein BU14_0072s0017 [Porphyra umbilicalis]|eukprot:OSX79659.1 hypothetical protein BU14_0072s0017 [Porphyra umbilicalis]
MHATPWLPLGLLRRRQRAVAPAGARAAREVAGASCVASHARRRRRREPCCWSAGAPADAPLLALSHRSGSPRRHSAAGASQVSVAGSAACSPLTSVLGSAASGSPAGGPHLSSLADGYPAGSDQQGRCWSRSLHRLCLLSVLSFSCRGMSRAAAGW